MRDFLRMANTLVLILIGAAIATHGARAQGPSTTTKTVWEGVYTTSQASRGQEVYDRKCTSCHKDDLSGGGDDAAAVLRGADFFARWDRRTVADLFRAISE